MQEYQIDWTSFTDDQRQRLQKCLTDPKTDFEAVSQEISSLDLGSSNVGVVFARQTQLENIRQILKDKFAKESKPEKLEKPKPKAKKRRLKK